MLEKPTYEELEKRVSELEQQIDHYKTAEIQNPPELLPVLMDAFRYIPTCRTLEDAVKEIFNQCKQITGAQSGYVVLLSDEGDEDEVLFLDAGGLQCNVDSKLPPMPIRGLREVAHKTKDVAYDNEFAKSPWMKYMPDGHVKLDNVLFSPINFEGKTVGVIGIANKPGGFSKRDVYNSKILGDLAAVALTYAMSQDSLRESEIKYRHLVTNLPGTAYQFLLTPEGDFKFEYIEERCVELFGVSASDIRDDANLLFDLIPQPDADIVHEAIMGSAASLTPYHVEHRVHKKDGSTVWIVASSTPRKLDGGIIIWDGLALNITKRKQAEEALRKTNRLISMLSECNQLLIRSTDGLGFKSLCKIIVEIGGYRLAWVGLIEKDENKTVNPVAHHGFNEGYIDKVKIALNDPVRSKGPAGTAILTKKPSIIKNISNEPDYKPWRDEASKRGYKSCIAIPLIEGDEVFGVLNIYSNKKGDFDKDETKILLELASDLAYGIRVQRNEKQRKQIEMQNKEALKEKGLLLKEVHHRVKNNLEIISSIVDLQIMRTKSVPIISLLEDIHEKIHTMALIHTQLYQSNRVDQINMTSHIQELLEYLTNIYSDKNSAIGSNVSSSAVYLSLFQAIPCALILNELISNAFKHAFVDISDGKIEISIKKQKDDKIVLIIKDDGQGIPKEVDVFKTESLGFKLVRNIMKGQLMGTLSVEVNGGTTVTVEFPGLPQAGVF